jgi:hypothetical protein
VHVYLHERCVADDGEAVHLAGFDDQDLAGAGLELLSFDDIPCASRVDELDLVIRMAVRTGPAAGLSVEEERRDADVAVLLADEVVRAALVRKILLTNAKHWSYDDGSRDVTG